MRLYGHRRGGAYPVRSTAGSSSAALAREWAESGSVALSAVAAVSVASVSITPNVTGKFRVIVTGRVDDDSSVQNGLLIYVGHGPADPPTSDYSITSTSTIPLDADDSEPFSIVVDLDKVAVTFPVGTAVTIAVAIQTTAGAASVTQSGVQIEVQEVI